jgi:hypothetical protein
MPVPARRDRHLCKVKALPIRLRVLRRTFEYARRRPAQAPGKVKKQEVTHKLGRHFMTAGLGLPAVIKGSCDGDLSVLWS